MELRDFDMDEPLTCEVVAERIGARRSLVVRLEQRVEQRTPGHRRQERIEAAARLLGREHDEDGDGRDRERTGT